MPERGYHLELITPVPLPRKPSATCCACRCGCAAPSGRRRGCSTTSTPTSSSASAATWRVPAYLAARRRRVPVVVHEANASAGWANKLGARSARRVLSAVADPGLPRAEVVGVPVRAAITSLDRMRERRKSPRPLRIRRRRAGASGVRRFAGCAVDQPGRRTRGRRACRGGYLGAARARSEEHPRSARRRPKATRRTWPCRIWTGWTWPTPQPIWRSAGRAR